MGFRGGSRAAIVSVGADSVATYRNTERYTSGTGLRRVLQTAPTVHDGSPGRRSEARALGRDPASWRCVVVVHLTVARSRVYVVFEIGLTRVDDDTEVEK